MSLGRVYTYGVTGMLCCWAADTGKPLWQLDVHKTFDVKQLKYGVTSSPLIEGNRVLVHVGGPDATLAAFDAESGKVIWKALNDPISTSAPTVIPGGKRQVVFQTGLRLVSLDPLDGSLLWEYPLAETTIDSMGALLWTGDVLLSSSVHFGGRGLKIEGKEGKLKASELWLNDKLGSYYAAAVPVGDGCFFMVTNTPMPGACAVLRRGKDGASPLERAGRGRLARGRPWHRRRQGSALRRQRGAAPAGREHREVRGAGADDGRPDRLD